MPKIKKGSRPVIYLSEKIRIRKDANQVILEFARKSQIDDSLTWDQNKSKYFGRLENLFSYLLEKKILSKHHNSIKTMAEYMVNTRKMIKKLIGEIEIDFLGEDGNRIFNIIERDELKRQAKEKGEEIRKRIGKKK